MKNIPLVVGNRVTFKLNRTGSIQTVIIQDELTLKKISDKEKYEILKVEACNWEEIEFEEEKELLTKEEKEFLKSIIKWYDDIASIYLMDTYFNLNNSRGYSILATVYPKNIKFKNIKRYKEYTIKELGLEE